MVEKLITELRRIKKDNPNVKLGLDNDVGLLFFPELYNTLNIPIGGNADFNKSLKDYTASTTAKLQSLGSNWTNDHELILYTILQDRFTMANIIRQANVEIDRSRSIADVRGNSLKERENQFFQTSKILADTQKNLNDLLANNPSLADNQGLRRLADSLNGYATSGWTVNFDEPVKNLGDFVGSGNDWNRLSSFAREREAEIELLKRRIYDIQKASIKVEYSGIDTERTLTTLRNENVSLVKEIDRLRSTASIANNSAAREKELELKLRTANARIQELESQLRTSELKLKELKDTKSSAASSVDPNTNLISSQYSSTSSTDQYAGRKTYDTPSYGVNSSYSEVSNVSSEVKTPSYVQQTTSNVYGGSYGNYQTSTTKLTSSGRDLTTGTTTTTTYGTSGNTYGTTPATTTTYGNTGNTTTTTSTYGTTPVTGTYGSGSTTGVTSATTYGTQGVTSGTTYGTSPSSSLTGSRTAGTTYGTSGTTYGTSGTTGTTYGTTGITSGTTGTSGYTSGATYGATSGSTYGTSGATSGYTSTYGTTGATGTSGVSGSYGTSGASSSSGSSSYTSSLRPSGSGSSSSSGYQFQSKKY